MAERGFEVRSGFKDYKKYMKSFHLVSEKEIDAIKEDWDTTEHYIRYRVTDEGEIEINFHFKGVIEDEEVLAKIKDYCDKEKQARKFWDKVMKQNDESYNPSGTSSHGANIKNGY